MRFARTLRRLLSDGHIGGGEFARAALITPGYCSKLLLRPDRNLSSAVLCRIVFAFATLGKPLTGEEVLNLLEARYIDAAAGAQQSSGEHGSGRAA